MGGAGALITSAASMTGSLTFAWRMFWAFANFVGQWTENVTIVQWFTSLGNANTMDTYFVLLVTGLSYPILFFGYLLFVAIKLRRKDGRWYSFKLPFILHLKLGLIGFLTAVNGVLTLAASPSDRTPPFIQQTLFTLSPLFTAILNRIWLKESMAHYNNKLGYFYLVCMLASFGLALAPPVQDAISGDDQGNNTVFWSVIFTLGSFAACAYNVAQKWWLTASADLENKGLLEPAPESFQYFRMMFWGSIYQLLSITAFMPVDIIPGFGDSSSSEQFVQHAENVLSSSFFPWLWTEYNYAGLLGFAFNVGYFISFVASLRLNHESVVFCALANVVVSWGAQVFFYLVPALQGPVDLPWWSIWLPLVLGGIGVVGFAALEDKKTAQDLEYAKLKQANNVFVNTSDDETQPLLVAITTEKPRTASHVGHTHY